MDRVAFTRNTLRDFVSHFRFGVADDNIIIRNQERIGDFTLCGKGLPEPGVPRISPLGFLSFFLSTMIRLFDRAFSP